MLKLYSAYLRQRCVNAAVKLAMSVADGFLQSVNWGLRGVDNQDGDARASSPMRLLGRDASGQENSEAENLSGWGFVAGGRGQRALEKALESAS